MVNLNVIRTYANRDGCLNFRLSNSDGEWYGLYKGVRFDFDQTVEDLDYQLNKVKKQSKVDAELKNPHMANKLIGVMTYNYTEEDVAFIMVNFVKCSEEAEKIGSELLTNVGFKHVLDDEKLEEIFNKVTLEGLRKGLDNYVGYLVVDAGFNVDTFNHRMGGKIVKEELNLLDFQKFSDAIKASNVKYHMDWIDLVDRIMMKKFNAIISERYRSLYFSDPNEVERYVKVRG